MLLRQNNPVFVHFILISSIQICDNSILDHREDLINIEKKNLLSQHNNYHSPNMNEMNNMQEENHYNFMIENEEENNNYIREEIPIEWGQPIHDDQTFWMIKAEQLEYRYNDAQDSFNWEINSWIGRDYEKIYFKTEGEVGLEESEGEAELQILYSKLISPYWDLQMGLRYDQLYGDHDRGRGFGVIGIQGVAPYLVEVDSALFISHEGDISARFSAEKDFLLSQRLILTPEIETNIAIQTVEDFGIGSGFNDIELGLRLRYEINRNFAPYLGINWERKLFDTAEFAQEEGENIDTLSVVGGIRLMF